MKRPGLLPVSHRTRRFSLVSLLVLLAFVPGGPPPSVSAQGDVTDSDLARASAGRVIRVGQPASGRITSIPLEVYVARVLAGEGEPRAADAAQQALAIAIRTFASANPGRHARDGYDLCDETHCQVLRMATAASRRAALATAGEILTFEGHAAEVFYSASCGGQSEAAADIWPGATYPYLQSVVDDVHEGDVPWTIELTLSDIERALRRAGFAGSALTEVSIESRSVSGRVARLRLPGLEPDVIAGDPFRRAIGASVLRSTAFTMTRTPTGFRFVGRGYGHGVGMCVIGAGRRAQRGESAHDILSRYFPGLSIVRLESASSLTRVPAPTPVAPPISGRPDAATPMAANVLPRNASVTIVGVSGRADELDRIAVAAHDELSKTLGVVVSPITIELHDTLDAFRLATGRPWWVNAVAGGTTIDLAPLPVLAQRDGIPAAIRIAIAELLVAAPLADRPEWVRVGASRYFARTSGVPQQSKDRVRCPADAELTLAISATAQREAEARAESCFARAFAATRDWRSVR